MTFEESKELLKNFPDLRYRPGHELVPDCAFGLNSNARYVVLPKKEEELARQDLPGLVKALQEDETFLGHPITVSPLGLLKLMPPEKQDEARRKFARSILEAALNKAETERPDENGRVFVNIDLQKDLGTEKKK